jgi:serine/threonine protein kinase
VETAHRAHITHRDIKPANVLISAYGAPGLTDFGIAGRGGGRDGRDGDVAESTDDVGVSVPWAPPEVLYGQSNGDERSDVYSLAATLWHLLVGRSPFEAPGGDNSAYALMPRIRSTPPPATGRPDVPPGLERLLALAMAKDPSRRPATALDLARALQAVEQQQRLARTPIVVLDEQGHTTLVSQTQGSPAGPESADDDRTRIKAPQTVIASPRRRRRRSTRTLDGARMDGLHHHRPRRALAVSHLPQRRSVPPHRCVQPR